MKQQRWRDLIIYSLLYFHALVKSILTLYIQRETRNLKGKEGEVTMSFRIFIIYKHDIIMIGNFVRTLRISVMLIESFWLFNKVNYPISVFQKSQKSI